MDRLPPEVKKKIYNLFPQCEVLPLRLVCRDWKNEIDGLYLHTVQLHDKDPKRTRRLTNLKVKECSIGTKDRNQGLYFKELFKRHSQTIFKYPSLLTCLNVVLEDFNISWRSKGISVANLNAILRQCSKYLEKLTVWFDRMSSPQANITYGLENIKVLKLHVTRNHLQDCWEDIFVQILQSASVSYRLKELEVNVRNEMLNTRVIIVPLIKLIESQKETLSTLKLCLGSINLTHSLNLALKLYEKMKYPTKLHEIEFKFEGPKMCPILSPFVNELIIQQRELHSLELKHTLPNDYITAVFDLPNFLLVKQIEGTNNSNSSLTHICIHLPTKCWNQRNGVFDFGTFEKCKNLKVFDLKVEDWFLVEEEENIKTLNLEQITMSYLIVLRLVGFLVPTVGLNVVFIQELKLLKVLELFHCGSTGDFGLNGTILERIFELRNVTEINVLNFNCEVGEELEKLKSMCVEWNDKIVVTNPATFCLYLKAIDINAIRNRRNKTATLVN